MNGVITQWNEVDGVGRIRLDNGVEVRFGATTSVRFFVPREGMRVNVCDIAPHPLGGDRATAIEPIDEPERTAYAEGLAADTLRYHLDQIIRDVHVAFDEALSARAEPTIEEWFAAARAGLDAARIDERVLDDARIANVLARGVGARSYLGGVPELPRGTAWPTVDGRPLRFFAQIIAAELPADLAVPRDLVLHVFCDLDSGTGTNGCILVTRDGDAVEPLSPPSTIEVMVRRDVRLQPVLTLPRNRFNGDKATIYDELVTAIDDRVSCIHQLGGHVRVDAMPPDADPNWRVLLQTDDGYSDSIVVWVRAGDAAGGEFSKASFEQF